MKGVSSTYSFQTLGGWVRVHKALCSWLSLQLPLKQENTLLFHISAVMEDHKGCTKAKLQSVDNIINCNVLFASALSTSKCCWTTLSSWNASEEGYYVKRYNLFIIHQSPITQSLQMWKEYTTTVSDVTTNGERRVRTYVYTCTYLDSWYLGYEIISLSGAPFLCILGKS